MNLSLSRLLEKLGFAAAAADDDAIPLTRRGVAVARNSMCRDWSS
jgi:hypothetical protein